MKKRGKVYLVGAGPGDPGLITVKALQCLREADVVIYDYLVGRDILGHVSEGARQIYVGKRAGCHTLRQDKINELLTEEAQAGNTVVRLKGGDPFILGRGGEEAEALAKAGIPFEVVPGVTSAVAVPAYAGIPLTHRSYASTVAFVTGHEDRSKENGDVDWHTIAGIGTLVFLMAMRNLPHIVANLTAQGKDPDTPAALIRWGTTPDQETLVSTLGSIVHDAQERNFLPPSVLVVGGVVNLRETINWFENKPLFGKGIVITRPKEQAEEFAHLLRSEGARVIAFPTIKVVPIDNWQYVDRAIESVASYQWIIFTSANGATFFFQRLREVGRDVRALKGVRICAIGPATARVVEERGIRVDLVPENFIAEGVVKAFQDKDIKGRRILLPRAEVARDVIPEELTKLGAQVDVVTIYCTLSSQAKKAVLEGSIKNGDVDVITFTSPSTVKHFLAIMGKDFLPSSDVRIACIGPVTAEAVEKAGLKTDIMGEPYTIPGLVGAMGDYFSKQ